MHVPMLSRQRFQGKVAQTHTSMVTILLCLLYYDVVLRYERHASIMTLHYSGGGLDNLRVHKNGDGFCRSEQLALCGLSPSVEGSS